MDDVIKVCMLAFFIVISLHITHTWNGMGFKGGITCRHSVVVVFQQVHFTNRRPSQGAKSKLILRVCVWDVTTDRYEEIVLHHFTHSFIHSSFLKNWNNCSNSDPIGSWKTINTPCLAMHKKSIETDRSHLFSVARFNQLRVWSPSPSVFRRSHGIRKGPLSYDMCNCNAYRNFPWNGDLYNNGSISFSESPQTVRWLTLSIPLSVVERHPWGATTD